MEIFVPGRLAILGEHTDWICSYRESNATLPFGMCLVCATNEGLYAKANVKDDEGKSGLVLTFTHAEKGTYNAPLDVKWLEKEAQKDTFFSYIAELQLLSWRLVLERILKMSRDYAVSILIIIGLLFPLEKGFLVPPHAVCLL